MSTAEQTGQGFSGPITTLLIAVDMRKQRIEEAKTIKRKAAEHYTAEKARAQSIHRDANRDFMATITEARAAGMQMNTIAKTVEVSVQTISQIRRTIAEWNREEAEAAEHSRSYFEEAQAA